MVLTKACYIYYLYFFFSLFVTIREGILLATAFNVIKSIFLCICVFISVYIYYISAIFTLVHGIERDFYQTLSM